MLVEILIIVNKTISEIINSTSGTEMLFCLWLCIHKPNKLIQFYQVVLFYSAQRSLQSFRLTDYRNTR